MAALAAEPAEGAMDTDEEAAAETSSVFGNADHHPCASATVLYRRHVRRHERSRADPYRTAPQRRTVRR